MERSCVHKRGLALIATLVTLVAFVVRLVWILRVQSPHAAVYSDMGGYVDRAEELLGLREPGDPRYSAFYPWGTHVLFAAEFAVLGRHSEIGIAIVHALVGALPAGCVTLITARLDRSRIIAGAAGLVAALWHPQITYAGYFLSEIWFTAAILLASWLFLRHMEGRSGSFGTGCAIALAFVVRPQAVLTCAVVGLASLLRGIRALANRTRDASSRWLPRRAWRWALICLPVAVAIGGSSVRLYKLSGRYGLISENEAVVRLFGMTDVARLEATWTSKDGRRMFAWTSPQLNHPVTPQNLVRIDGYLADPEIIARIQKERLEGVPLSARLRRMRRNIEHLVLRNYPNPEADFHSDPFRFRLQRVSRLVMLNVLLPLAAIGLWTMRRRRAAIVVLANLATVLGLASIYYAEARYRVPYDPFIIIAAAVGLGALARGLHRLWIHVLRRRAARAA